MIRYAILEAPSNLGLRSIGVENFADDSSRSWAWDDA
jgi:hypothetical protein